MAGAAARALGHPMCGKCGKPVDRVETYPDAMTARIVFVAYCHGAWEETKLAEEVLEDMVPHRRISFGVAFRPREALPPTAAAPPAHSQRRFPPTG